MTITPCMGGWCTQRDRCPNYHSESRAQPAERLCEPGQDGIRDGYPVRIHRPAGQWERLPSQVTPADPFQALMESVQ